MAKYTYYLDEVCAKLTLFNPLEGGNASDGAAPDTPAVADKKLLITETII